MARRNKKQKVSVDSVTRARLLNRYLAYEVHSYFTLEEQKVPYKVTRNFKVQWQNIASDLAGLFRNPVRLAPHIAYSLAAFIFIALNRHDDAMKIAFTGAVSFDASASAANTDTSITFSHTCSNADRTLVVGFLGRNSPQDDVTGITYNGVALTDKGSVATTVGADIEAELWSLAAPATGSNSVVISGVTNFENHAGISISFNGSSGEVNGFASDAGNLLTASSAVVTSASGDMVVDFNGIDFDGGGVTVGADQTSRVNTNDGGGVNYASSTEPGGVAITMTWSWNNSKAYAHVAANVVAGAQAGPANAQFLQFMGPQPQV